MGIIGFLIHLFELTFMQFGHIGVLAVDAAAAGMRAPLESMGLKGVCQTLLLALVPLLTLIITVKLLGGAVRFVVAVCMAGALMRILWPLVGEVSNLV